MTSKTLVLSMFAISAILVGSISVSGGVFATSDYDSWNYKSSYWNDNHDDKYDKNPHHKKNKSNDSIDSRIYVNSLSFDLESPSTLDSCESTNGVIPCVLINPFDDEQNMETIFVADPELKTTRTVININVFEKDNFPSEDPTSPEGDEFFDITTFPECFEITVASFNVPLSSDNPVNGIVLDCSAIETGQFDVTYSFLGPDQDFSGDDDNDDNDDDDNDDDDNDDDDNDDDDNDDD